MITGLALVVAGAAVVLWSAAAIHSALEARRLLAAIGADAYLVPFSDDYQGSAVAVSPDGKTLIFMGVRKAADSRPQLFVRKLDQLQATPLDGTEGAFAPFFSPDSEWVAFFVESGQTGTLKKIPVGGGAVVKICDTAFPRGGWWSENGTIVFGQISKPTTTLLRVASAGGTPVAFGAFSPGATSQRWPQVLPGGTHVIYTEHSNVSRFDYANLMVVPLNGGAPKVVVKGGFYGRSVTIGSKGYLTYVRQSTLMASTLMAVPFDLSRMETTGPAVPVVEDVALAGNGGSASVAMLPDGALVYVPATDVQTPVAIQWLSREGKISLWRTATNGRRDGQFSRDGQQFAFTERGQPRQLFVQSLTREIPTQVAAPGGATSPVWTPDGKRVAFGLDQGVGVSNLWMANADGSGTPTRLTTSTNDQQPSSWDPTGKWLAYTEIRPNTTRDVMILPVQDNATDGWTAGPPIVFKGTAVNERDPAFSPDGRWIAYEADDIYVSPFPGPGATVRISSEGGSTPQWSATSKELLFLSRGKIMSVSSHRCRHLYAGRAEAMGATRRRSSGQLGTASRWQARGGRARGCRRRATSALRPRQDRVLVGVW